MARRFLLTIILAVAMATPTIPASAHHGWSWTTGDNIDLTGIIKSVSLGNPHGIVQVDVDGEAWTVEVGQPWRNDRAGLKDGDLAQGVELRVIGEPSADISDRRVKAERLYLNGREYVLYPRRD
ncbi:DUF6152 family protein [Dichotomicrobium thermohalophilum]|uniref:DUF5666 domain-containing protein n=1 Tax=Dichotomicrobium thermohalophilum TaxID=933063 RepID=A0A397PDV3_9HYPH|nr:DUF6152 family protein [Dichotomicrobium thermohalophilum]RIA47680.1 hypothetical protein BXY53_2243 [Dichotomicrobium thermohalophilum]